MKRNRIWGLGLALTLVLGCWVGSTSARLLTDTGSLLVPYYEAQGNLATLIGVQHVGAQTAGVSIINVTVHDPDGGAAAGGYICLGPNEFGYVVLQNATPPLDEDFGIYFSVARDAIDRTGFVGLAYAGTRNSCSDGSGAVAGASADVMVAWAVLQDVGSGFFATEIPVVQVGWEVGVTGTGLPEQGLQPYCRSNATRARDYSDAAFNSDKTACADPSTHTFFASGPYCYDHTATPLTRARVDAQLNAAGTGCNNEFTHTFVPANTILPAIPAPGPRADVSDANGCDAVGECPGLAFNGDGTAETIGARFDVLSSNGSVSNVYLWLDTAPLDGREAEFSVICEDGMAQERMIDIDDHVTVINPRGMGCSGRGVLELTLPERTSADDGCYVSNDPAKALVTGAEETAVLDDLNNRCRSFAFTNNINNDATTGDPGCYDRGIVYVFTNDINNDGTTGDPGCYDRNAFPRSTASVTAVERSTNGTVTSCHSRPISTETAVEIQEGGAATSCKSYTYKKAVTADSPSGYMFSHISQAGQHYRMNFPGYEK